MYLRTNLKARDSRSAHKVEEEVVVQEQGPTFTNAARGNGVLGTGGTTWGGIPWGGRF